MTNPEPTVNGDQKSLQEIYFKSFEALEEGQLIEGKIVETNPETVFIDVGYKSEGKIPLSDFDTPPHTGDIVSVILISKEGRSGEVIISKKKADLRLFWKLLRKAQQNNEPVKGTFIHSINGGFEVDLGYNVIGFNPISKTDIMRVENPEEYINLTSNFLIDRLYSGNNIKIILSRRGWLEREIDQKRKEFFNTINVGDLIKGTVKNITSFGAFIDLGGFDALLHINDMSWGHVIRPKDYVKKDQTLELKVIKMNLEENKINLSLKHLTPDPWSSFEEKYKIDDIVKGKVTKLTDFGAFIELEDGIEGLAHISELSWVNRIKHPKELFSIGDEVEVKILSYDLELGRVSLGVKQVLPNPWDNIEKQYPVGMRLTKQVKKTTNTGAVIELEEGIDGFLSVDDMSWIKKIKYPSSIVRTGDEIETIILEIDKENKRISLGLKQLSDDPWESLCKAYSKGKIIEGEISNITDFGIFLKVQGGIEGLINKYNIAEQHPSQDEDIFANYKKGDKLKAVITEINLKNQRLSLSIRDYQSKLQREELSKYIHDDNEPKVTLGDFLKDKSNDTLNS